MGRVSLTAQHQLAAVPDPAGLEIPVLQRDPLPLEAGQQLRPAPVQKAARRTGQVASRKIRRR